MKSFIYQIEKEELETHQNLYMYGVENLKSSLQVYEKPYILYVQKQHFEELNINSDNINLADEHFLDKNNNKVIKLEIKNKELYQYLVNNFKECEYPIYEEDLPAEHQILIEDKIQLLKGKTQDIDLKTISLDIETIGEIDSQEIVLISTYTHQNTKYNCVYINESLLPKDKVEKVRKASYKDFVPVFCKDEKEVLENVQKDIIEFAPQIILGWNVIDFDFKIIKERMKAHNLEFSFSPFQGRAKMRIAKDFFGKSSLSFPGVIVFDVIQLLKTNFITFDDFKLNTVAKEVLKDEKIAIEDEGDADNGIENKIDAITNMLNYDPITLIEYNFKDSLLTQKIAQKLQLLELMVERSAITNTPLVKVQSPIASLDIMYLTQLKQQHYVANSHYNFTDTSQIEGAYVINPKPNFYENVFVFDFKSLYPSIIMTFNIDPFTYKENGDIEAPNQARFSSSPGILPQLIEMLFKEREKAKKQNNDVKAGALKITMNSFYGAIASPKSRFYNKEIGEAITSFGRYIIQKSKYYVEEEKKIGQVIYGDTDSIFVKSEKSLNTLEEKKEFGNTLANNLNQYFKKWCREEFNGDSKLTIEMEKIFSKFFIASKKRYVGYDELINQTVFTGLEAVRGDWTSLGREFQKKLVNLIFEGGDKKDIENFFYEEINKLKQGEYDDLLTYRKKLSKPLESYTKTTPPHVKAAREVEGFSGKIVDYVMTKEGPKHVSLLSDKHEIDYDHYIEKQLKGVSDDFLEALGLDFDKIIGKKNQKSLSQFF